MPTMDDIYSSYLTADHVKEHGGEKVTVIKGVEARSFGEKKKLVLALDGFEKDLVVNATNANEIAKIAGTKDYSKWVGVKVTLYSTKVQFRNEMVDAIRVKA